MRTGEFGDRDAVAFQEGGDLRKGGSTLAEDAQDLAEDGDPPNSGRTI